MLGILQACNFSTKNELGNMLMAENQSVALEILTKDRSKCPNIESLGNHPILSILNKELSFKSRYLKLERFPR